jgi:hypothetical protein
VMIFFILLRRSSEPMIQDDAKQKTFGGRKTVKRFGTESAPKTIYFRRLMM